MMAPGEDRAPAFADTSVDLLRQIAKRDEGAWEEFAVRYSAFLRAWCDRWDVPPEDAEDLIQDTFLKVLARVSDFQRERVGSFRAWIKTVAWHSWCQVIQRVDRQRNIEVAERFRRSQLSLESLEDGLERLIREELLSIGMAETRRRVDPKTWEAFRLLTFEGLSGAETAQRLGLSIPSVYMAKCRVQRGIMRELKRLESKA